MMKRSLCIVVAVLVFAPTALPQTAKRPISLEDLWKVKRLGKPSIAPDGAWVAVDVTSFDMTDNSSHTQIWLCATDGKTQKQLTTHKVSSSGPIWSLDGKSIAFTSKRGDRAQIYVISPDGGAGGHTGHRGFFWRSVQELRGFAGFRPTGWPAGRKYATGARQHVPLAERDLPAAVDVEIPPGRRDRNVASRPGRLSERLVQVHCSSVKAAEPDRWRKSFPHARTADMKSKKWTTSSGLRF